MPCYTCKVAHVLAELAEADSMDSAASSHHASFPDVVCVEQQKAQGVSRVLSSWSSTDGKLLEAFLARPRDTWRCLSCMGPIRRVMQAVSIIFAAYRISTTIQLS